MADDVMLPQPKCPGPDCAWEEDPVPDPPVEEEPPVVPPEGQAAV